MNLPVLCIHRPVMTTLLMAAILIFGTMAYQYLPVSDMPTVDYPTVSVSASLTGASPETMAATVATPLERQFSSIDGVDSINSVSSLGSTRITIQFSLDRDIDSAAQDVQSAISRVQRRLPKDMNTPPSYNKQNPADRPVLFIGVHSSSLPMYEVNEYAENILGRAISMVTGVAKVDIWGGKKYAVRIQLNPDALAAKGVSVAEISTAVEKANVNLPNGSLQGDEQSFTIEAGGQLEKAEYYRPLIVSYQNGNPVRLEQLGRVIDSIENDKRSSWYMDERSIVLAVYRQPGVNTVALVDSVKEVLPSLASQIPPSVEVNPFYDRAATIRESVADVKFTLKLTVALVIMVIFLFLRNISATIIPTLAIPMSIIGTFAIIHYFDYSLNNLTLMALTLSVGFVVDDAIVMLENIMRHRENGASRMEAAIRGSKEIGFTIISITLSLAAVFLPVLFMGGLLGRLLHEFAVTIISAVLISGFVSLTLTPLMCSRFISYHPEKKHNVFYEGIEKSFQSLINFYTKTLKIVFKHRFVTLMFTFVVIGLSAWLFIIIPKGFFPSEDTGTLDINVEGIEGISFESMERHILALNKIVAACPEVLNFTSNVGNQNSQNSGSISIRLKPMKERKKHVDQIIQELRPKLQTVPGVKVYLSNPPIVRIGGLSSKSLYQYTLQGINLHELYLWAPKLQAAIQNIPGIRDVASDLLIKNPQLNVTIDRDKVASMGLTVDDVENALYNAYGTRQISTIYASVDQYSVLLETLPELQRTPETLETVYVRSEEGNLIPLSTVATWERGFGPMSVSHYGQLPAVTLSFNLAPGVALGTVVEQIESIAQSMNMPSSITGRFQGQAEAFQSSMKGMGMLLILCVLIIYIILGILYESFIHPLTILSGLPAAGFGALITLMLFGLDLNIYGFVGLIMLVGIVKKNAIMIIDFALEAQRSGSSPEEAIFKGCILRFRPIMMTTLAAITGALPIAFGYGAGGEARQPLGLSVTGGLLVSQVITLYITPVIYLYFEDLRNWISVHWNREKRKELVSLSQTASMK